MKMKSLPTRLRRRDSLRELPFKREPILLRTSKEMLNTRLRNSSLKLLRKMALLLKIKPLNTLSRSL